VKAPETVPVEAAAGEFDYTASFQRFTQPESFSKFCLGYPNPGNAVTYVYRLAPKIDREQSNNRETAIEKVAGETVDYDYLARKWGSGRYMLLYNDLARPRDLQQVAKCTIEIDDPLLPPELDPAELVVSDRNAAVISRYLNMGWTIVETTNDLKPTPFKQLAPPSAGNAADKVLAETVQKLALQGAERRPNGGDELEVAFKIADRLKPAEDKLSTGLLYKLIDVVLTRQNPAPVAPPPSDSVATLRTTMQFLREEMGWSPAAGETAGTSILGGGAMKLLELAVSQMAVGFGQALATRFGPAVLAPAPVLESSPATVGNMPQPEPVMPEVVREDPMLNPVKLKALIAVGQSAVDAFDRGVSGDDFAEWLCSKPETATVYDDLVSMGKQGILGALSVVPGLAEKLAPKRAAYEEWLDDFLAYNEQDAAPAA
jgi:hypothetical protein